MQVIAGSSPRRRRRNSRRLPYIIIRPNGVSITDARYGGSVTRASIALQFNYATSSYIQVASGVDRAQHDVYSSGLAAWQLNYRLAGEPQRTNSALGSNLFADGTYWGGNTNFTISSATSCIPGQTAYRHLGKGSGGAARTQSIGTFVSGQTDVIGQIFEQDLVAPATASDILLYDLTAPGTVSTLALTWATMALTVGGSPAAYGYVDLGTGPNGGRMVFLWMTNTGKASGIGGAGNTRYAEYRPNAGSTALTATILHHAQFEANALFPSTPIVTGAATATRNAEIQSVPLPVAAQSAQALAIYEKWVAGGGSALGTTGYRWNIGGSSAPLFSGAFNSSAQPTATINNGTDTAITDTAPAVAPAFSDGMESRDLVATTGAMQTGAAKNGGAETLAAASAAPAHGIVVPLGANTVYLGSLGATAGHGAALGTFILAAGAPSMAQFRSM